jgi:hypothetical protein
MEHTVLWVVGKYIGEDTECESRWELQGVFSSEDLAIDACKKHKDFFIGPVFLNKEYPYDTTEWVGSYYPNIKRKLK